ncbi:MAG TPA: hypothetical protein VMW27_21610 [Thermoanaerobaculia bacterium]|nr:hypothetical protein [Thermoanaerobaculia bacterium]
MKARLIPVLAVLVLLGFGRTGLCEEPGTGRDRRLLQASEQALDSAGRAAERPSAGFRAGDPRHEAFWDAIERMDHALAEVERTMSRRDRSFFLALREGTRSLTALRVAWQYSGVEDPAIDAELDALARSYRALRAGFGAEQRRYQQGGGELSEEERRRFQEIQRAQVRFIALLQPLRARAVERGDRRRVADIDRLVDRADEVASADLTLDNYIHASMMDDVVQGEWEAAASSAPIEEREAWREADAIVQELFVEEDAGFVFSVDLGAPADAQSAGVRVYEGGETEVMEAPAGDLEAAPTEETGEEAEAPGEDLEAVPPEENLEIAEEDLPVEETPAAEAATPPADKAEEKAPETKKPVEEPAPAPPTAVKDAAISPDEVVEVEDVSWVEMTGEEAEGFEGVEPPAEPAPPPGT